MKTLSLDLETYSDVDIKNGVYKYTDSDAFEILWLAYSIDGLPVIEVDMTENELPQEVIDCLLDETVIKTAWNAQFERVALSRTLKRLGLIKDWLDPKNWRCSMVYAMELSLPASLGRCASYLGVTEQKDTVGKSLINYFSKPCKPTKVNGMRTRNLPEHDPEKWQLFGSYCGQDVRTEQAILKVLQKVPLDENEWRHYETDQRINDRGVELDHDLIDSAVSIMAQYTEELQAELKAVTGLDNPNSVKQFKEWLAGYGYELDSIGKKLLQGLLKLDDLDSTVRKAIKTRLELSNGSTKKYITMENIRCKDDRAHGLIQFAGTHTARWAGRLVQVQNLPKNKIPDIDLAREVVKKGNIEVVEILFDSVSDILKQLIRTAFIAKAGCTFYVSDFSAIEARVIAWYANESWRLRAFNEGKDIYCESASQMFGVQVEKHGVNGELRQKGKIAELALGYQGGVGAMKAMGAIEMGIAEDELQGIVDAWRSASPSIKQFWYTCERLAKDALKTGRPQKGPRGLVLYRSRGFLFIKLPSGRSMAFPKAKLVPGKYGDQIEFEGQGTKVFFEKLDTYGGKLVENVVQATARDILAEAIQRVEKAGLDVVFHVHDEIVAEAPVGAFEIEQVNRLMAEPLSWTEGLPLNSDGYITKYYLKD